MFDAKIFKQRKKTRLEAVTEVLAPFFEKFFEKFPNEEAVFDEIIGERLKTDNLRCRRCNSPNAKFSKGKSRRNFRCRDCGTRNSITVDTPLEGVTYVWIWRAIVWLNDENIIASKNCLAQIFGVSPNTIRTIQMSLLVVMSSLGLSATDQVGSSHFLSLFNKRSLATDKWEHPQTEEDEYCQDKADKFGTEQQTQEKHKTGEKTESAAGHNFMPGPQIPQMSKRDEEIIDALKGGPKSIGEICQALGKFETAEVMMILTLMELAGYVEQSVGNLYSLVEKVENTAGTAISLELRNAGLGFCSVADCKVCMPGNRLMSTEDDFVSFFAFIKGIFHGISRKYLQLYLVYQYFRDPLIRVVSSRESLFSMCLRHGYVGSKYLREYVSPPLVYFRPPIRGVAC